MKFTKLTTAVAAAVAATLALTACGSDDTASPEVASTSFADGTTMAKLQSAGKITLGTKYDQPLFGLAGPDGTPEGFDVEIGKIIAAKLGIDAGKIRYEYRGDTQQVQSCEGVKPRVALLECLLPNRRVEVRLLVTR